MKKLILLLSLLFALSSLCGCGSPSAPAATPVSTSAPQPTAEAASPAPTALPTAAPSAAPAPSAPASAASGGIDVDLTQLSSTMVYSEVYAMMYEPESYIGKSVKMRGSFSAFEVNGNRYFACIVQDATACCEQGLEFELKGSPRFPEDYPAPGSEITVTGIFDLYSEAHDGNTSYYIILREAELV